MNIACSFVPFVNTDCIHLISKTDISNVRLQLTVGLLTLVFVLVYFYTDGGSTCALMVGLYVN